jgi:phosphorylase/glycogen(starch) synthase
MTAHNKIIEEFDKSLPSDITGQKSNIENYQSFLPPKWKLLMVQKNIPEQLNGLEELSRNLWWSWNNDAEELFESIDPQLWNECLKNPIELLEILSYNRLLILASDDLFLKKLNTVYSRFKEYISVKKDRQGPKIAYLSIEYGVHSSMKIFSGGLGILAGDYLKEASDSNMDLVGVGLLYQYGYFRQSISINGDQVATSDQNFISKMPLSPLRDLDGNLKTISIVLSGRVLNARIWKVDVGRIELFLLDTDYEDNNPQDRSITHSLYGGDWENRFKQELVLGIGGLRALNLLEIEPDIFHFNEEHSAFLGIERLKKYIKQNGLIFPEALEIIRASTLFTTHTPKISGHNSFNEELLRNYLSHYPEMLGITWTQFMELGKINASDSNECFSMSILAANFSQEINGISCKHGSIIKEIFSKMWPGYLAEELHMSYVTNGIHYPTWTAKESRQLYENVFGENFRINQLVKERWDKVYEVPDKTIWEIREKQRRRLIEFIKERINESYLKINENPKHIVELTTHLNRFTLTIGFAHRFASFKRVHLLFKDLDRLARIVNNPGMPIQFIFAGKAHPNDKTGKDLIKTIVEISRRPEFIGKIVFLQNYDAELAKNLVQGVDVWLNTPTRLLEASGTSGMKAIFNGVLHLSILDGWWAEGYYPDAGWALPEEKTYDNNEFQDELDAELIYSLLENEIAPLFYFRNDDDDVPTGWTRYIKNSIAKIAPNFTSTRMIHDYKKNYYEKLYNRSKELKMNNFQLAKDLFLWKRKISANWANIKILSQKSFDILNEPVVIGKKQIAEVVLDLNVLSPDDVGIETVIAELSTSEKQVKVTFTQEFKLVNIKDNIATYVVEIVPVKTGIYAIGTRIFAKNPNLPHRQDFNITKWI